MKKIALPVIFLLVVLLGSGCATTERAKVRAYGLYAVNPVMGLMGVGYVDYDRTAQPEEKPQK